ncbi:MAG: 30S ribosomal protein S6 [Chloroflexota bacterium]
MDMPKEEGDQLRDYELMVIISPEVDEEGVGATVEKVNKIITDRGGSVTAVNQWGRRKFAYPIQRFTEGNYVLTQFRMEPKMAADLEASLRLTEEVLRHLLVRLGD